jgi:hypothetical protein
VTTRHFSVDQPVPYTVVDCDSCDVPMAVLGVHRREISADERTAIQRGLAALGDRLFPEGWFFDDHMRQIPDHYHCHVRPYPSWWPRRPARPQLAGDDRD